MESNDYSKVMKFVLDEIKTGKRGDVPQEVFNDYYTFRINFFKYIGVGELSRLPDYSQQALEYIDQVYPFCFMRNNEPIPFPESLTKYVLLLGRKESESRDYTLAKGIVKCKTKTEESSPKTK